MRFQREYNLLLFLFAFSFAALAAEPKVTQDLSGVLRGDFVRVEKPISSVALGAIQDVRGIWVTPDCKRVLIHEWKTDENKKKMDRLLVVDAATAKVERVLAERAGGWLDKRAVKITPDSKSAFIPNRKEPGLILVAIETGEITKTITFDKPFAMLQYNTDATRTAAMTEDGGTVVFDLAAGKAEHHKLAFLPEKAVASVLPLGGRSELLVHYGIEDKEKNFVTLFDPITNKAQPLTEFDGNATVLPSPDGKTACIFRQETAGEVVWTTIEKWELWTLKQVERQKLKPPLASIGLKLSGDGQTLFLHEYMVQPVVVWNLKNGTFAGLVAPQGGGCGGFDITPDGKKIVATVGPWKQGTLIPRELAVYDVSKLLAQP